MSDRVNPFHDLYLTEAIGDDSFVKLFSPVFMEYGTALYQPGNVILKGLQGSGKTMLLNLLKPEIRLAYANSDVDFPILKDFRKFISGGINLRKSGVAEFGQLILPDASPSFVRNLTLHFGDFVNYWVVQDLLKTIKLYSKQGSDSVIQEIGLHLSEDLLNEFAKMLSNADCWLGGIKAVHTFDELQLRLNERILAYRNYLNFNIDELPDSITSSKTAIGEPMAVTADLLKFTELLDDDVNVFIRIDQYEELPTLDFSGFYFGDSCQKLIHKALSARSNRVSYRIGARQYAWPESPEIYATTGSLENKRDFSALDIDETLRRSENRRGWLFPDLAEDVFCRRLKLTNYNFDSKSKHILNEVFSKTVTTSEKARLLVASESSRKSVVKPLKHWPNEWSQFLKDLAIEDPFNAKLAEAWAQQKDMIKQNVVNNIPDEAPYPWDKKYWKKERAEQALTQLASRNNQQLIWQGKDDVIGLSGGNILVFLFICQHIWDAWLRDTRDDTAISSEKLPNIGINAQSMGMINASEEWLKKPIEGKDSKRRLQFIKNIGYRYYNALVDDAPMSNPGHSGFSLPLEDLQVNIETSEFLNLAVDYGDLYESIHTSKSRGVKRKKYYLAPILCPAFKIPYKHIKEPEYMGLSKIEDIIQASDVRDATKSKSASNKDSDNLNYQNPLF
jgi:hypothetical protein